MALAVERVCCGAKVDLSDSSNSTIGGRGTVEEESDLNERIRFVLDSAGESEGKHAPRRPRSVGAATLVLEAEAQELVARAEGEVDRLIHRLDARLCEASVDHALERLRGQRPGEY